jgi:hypothetical protein
MGDREEQADGLRNVEGGLAGALFAAAGIEPSPTTNNKPAARAAHRQPLCAPAGLKVVAEFLDPLR